MSPTLTHTPPPPKVYQMLEPRMGLINSLRDLTNPRLNFYRRSNSSHLSIFITFVVLSFVIATVNLHPKLMKHLMSSEFGPLCYSHFWEWSGRIL